MDLSVGSLLASTLVSTVGLAFFLYGKKELRFPQLVGGLVLMGFPYFVGSALVTLAIGAVVVGAIWLLGRMVY